MDASLTATGLVVLEDQIVLHHETFKTRPNDGSDIDRQRLIVNHVMATLRNFGTASIALENYSFASRGDAITRLAELGGVLRFLLVTQSGCAVTIIPPGEWKKLVIGKGNAPKDVCRAIAYKRYKEEWLLESSEHEVDAFCVATALRLRTQDD